MFKFLKSLINPERYIDGFRLDKYKEPKNPLTGYCPWVCFVDEGVVLLKSGAIMKSFLFSCPDLGSSSPESIASVSYYFNESIKRLGSGWAVQFEVQRFKTREYPSCEFSNEAAFIIDKCREANFKKHGEHFASAYYITFTKELEADVIKKTGSFFLKNNTPKNEYLNTTEIKKEIANFIIQTEKIMSLLSTKLEVVPLNNQETASFLHTSVSTKWAELNMPNHFIFLDKFITDETLENSMPLKLGNKFIPVISVMDFPMKTYPAIFDALNAAGVEYRWSTRFICLDKNLALKEIEKVQKRFYGARKSAKQLVGEMATKIESGRENQGAMAMESDATEAQIECYTGEFAFGYYTSTLLVWDEDVDLAMEKARYLEGIINSCGFTSKIETHNALKAWLGMQPGNVFANVRRPLISTGVLSHIIPLSSIWQGMTNNNHSEEVTGVGAPLIAASTLYNTPFFWNLNVGDVGHCFIFGPTGAGKSTLLNLLEIQFLKYPKSNVVILDKDKSARAVTMATGGIYVEPGKDDIAFQPLKELETSLDLLWASEFIELLLFEQGVTATPKMKEAITEALNLLKTKDEKSRTLTSFQQYVNYSNEQGDNDIEIALSPYVKGGQYGEIFDADDTSMPLSKWTMIEMGTLMKLSEKAVAPALMFLFKYIEKIWEDKQDELTLLVLDEAWIFLQNPIFQRKIEDWLLTLRKKRVYCVFATQNIVSAKKSDISEIIVQQCLTKIYLADESATSPSQMEGYRYFGLTDSEIESIQRAVMKRDYLYKSSQGVRMFQLDLDRTQLSILSPNHDFLDLLEEKYERNCQRPLVEDILKHNNIDYNSFFEEE